MKKTFKELTSPESDTPGTGLALPGGDDFLARINATIINFKELIKLFKEVKGMTAGQENFQNPKTDMSPGNPSALNKNTVVQFLDVIIARGYGKTTIGQVLEKAGPLTIEQLKEIISRA